MAKHHAWCAAFAFVAFNSITFGQSFNIDLGLDGGPSSDYSAAGLAGHWIGVPGTQGVTVSNLMDVDGNITSAQFTQIGGTETVSLNDPAIAGADAILMNDTLITHTAVENCMFFSQMLPGRYAVLIYARMPNATNVFAVTDVDQELGNPQVLVGGVWPGAHAEGISYSRHIAEVAAIGAQAGRLGLHSGVPNGGDFGIGAALNGVQIQRLGDADLDDDGIIDGTDVDLLVAEIAAGTGGLTFDLTGDGLVDNQDLDQWLADAGHVNLPSGNTYLLGDANLDGFVDALDFIAWNGNKYTQLAAWTAGDFNADGLVDGEDFIVWNSFKFQAAAAVPVPEGSALALVISMVLAAAARHSSFAAVSAWGDTFVQI